MQRVTVIGSGASALAVLDVIAGRSDVRVTLIRPAHELTRRAASATETVKALEPTVESTISELRRDLGFKFPPPKSRFGTMPDTLKVENWGHIWRSNLHGGLTLFWGGSMVPFPDREFFAWPIGRGNLEKEYRAIAQRVGVTGGDDALRDYLADDFADLPQVEKIDAIEILLERLSTAETSSMRVIGGSARVAVETRLGRPNACNYSGECLTGCPHGSVFSALDAIERHRTQGAIAEEFRGMAERVDLDRKYLEVHIEDHSRIRVDYDIAFVCAGCVHSAELLMNSLEVEPQSPISDNAILSFPIFYGGRLHKRNTSERYFALTNGMVVLVPRAANDTPIFIQLYPNPDYFWQYNLPRWTWRALAGLARSGRNRLFWARAYLSSAQSQAYQMVRTRDGAALKLARQPDIATFTNKFWPELRRILAGAGFWVPPVAPVRARTSSHYTGGFPMGGQAVNGDGALGNGTYLCDAANFPDCAAFSPTFTIMANARRIARTALGA